MKKIDEIKKEFLARLKNVYGCKFTAKKVFDSGRFLGKMNKTDEFRNIRYRVKGNGYLPKTAYLNIDYATDRFAIEIF